MHFQGWGRSHLQDEGGEDLQLPAQARPKTRHQEEQMKWQEILAEECDEDDYLALMERLDGNRRPPVASGAQTEEKVDGDENRLPEGSDGRGQAESA